jgi:DNA polymerase-1
MPNQRRQQMRFQFQDECEPESVRASVLGDLDVAAPDVPAPGVAEPDAVEPDAVAPGAVEPGAVEPGAVEPGVVKPGIVEPDAVEPGAVEPGAVEPGAVEPGAVEPGAVEPGAVEPDVVEPDAVEPLRTNLRQTVYLVDAYSLIFQVFHALPEMTGPNGQPVAAIHGFARDLVDLLEKKKPDFLFCAFDTPGATFRDELFPEYKAGRREMPADLQLQIPQIRRVLDALGIPVLEMAGYEADDVLATVARRAERAGHDCYVVTSDKDCRQLITERVKVYNIRKDKVFDAAALQEEWGVRPDQVVDFQSLVGDAVDNVPGIPLIGPKIARELLGKYETLEGVLDHAAQVSGVKRRENLLQGRETAMLSRRLVRLVDDVPLEFDWDVGRSGRFALETLDQLCREYGFRKLADRVRRLSAAGIQESAGKGLVLANDQGMALGIQPASTDAGSCSANDFQAIWDQPIAKRSGPTEGPAVGLLPPASANYRTVATQHALDQFVHALSQQTRISIDTETTSTNPRWAELVGYSFAWQPGEAYYIPVRAPAGEPQLDPALVRDALRPVLENPEIEKIGQNLKYDIVVLRAAGIRVRGMAFDTMVADYLLDPGERNHSLDDLAKRHLGHTTIKIKELIGTGKSQKRMDQVPVPLITAYAAEDAELPVRLAEILRGRLNDEGLATLFDDLEMPLIDVLAEMEFNGIKVNLQKLESLGERFARRMFELEAEIYKLAGGEFNINSRLQLGKILFTDLKLPKGKTTKTGASTDAGVLEGLAKQHALPAKIIEYRQYGKLRSTYVDALIGLVHPQTGRVHTSFKQDVAATGRLSSTEPNLQNIPVRTDEGREIRAAFIAGESGWKLMTADYSQIELRVLAHFSGDRALQRAFAADEDIHAMVASEVYGVPLHEVTRELRRGAKAVNFGVIYGQSSFGLAKSLDIDQAQAAEFIEAYFARYPGVEDFVQRALAECRKKGYVSTVLGRKRTVQGVRDILSLGDSRQQQRNLPERIAINTVIQGSAADLIKKAMIQVHGQMRRGNYRARLLLQIHDELVLEAPSEEVERLAMLVRQEMESVARLSVPLKVDVKVGDNWADCEAWPGSPPRA